MIEIFFSIQIVMGAIATIFYKDPLDKLINLAVVTGGVAGLVAVEGFLDVAGLLAVILPISTIVTLMILIRMSEVIDKWI